MPRGFALVRCGGLETISERSPALLGPRRAGQGGFTGHNDNLIVFAILAILVLIALPNFMKARNSPALATRANMAVLQQAVERYAQTHAGYYPAGLQDTNFDWGRYVPPSPQPLANPYDPTLTNAAAVAPDVEVPEGSSAYQVALAGERRGEPGQVRYYVTKDRRSYALVAYDKAGPVREQLLLAEFGLETAPLLVYNNAQAGVEVHQPPPWWHQALWGAALVGIMLAILALGLGLIVLLVQAGIWVATRSQSRPPAR